MLKKKVLIGLGMLSVVIAGSCYYIYEANALYLRHISRPILWSGDEGAYISRNGGRTDKHKKFHSKTGQEIDAPFTFWQNHLVYWSRPDKAICVVPKTGLPQWIPVSNGLQKQLKDYLSDVIEILPYQHGVLLNMRNEDRSFAYCVNIENKTTAKIQDSVAAKGSETSETIAVLTPDQEIEIRSAKSTKVIKTDAIFVNEPMSKNWFYLDWAYDPQEKRIYVTNTAELAAISTETNKVIYRKDLPRLDFGHDIVPQNNLNETWICMHLPYSGGTYVLSFNNQGDQLGTVLESGGTINRPVLTVDEKMPLF